MFVSSPLAPVFPRGHRLAARRSIRLEDLTSEAFVLFPTSLQSHLLEIVTATCADAGFAPNVVQEAHHLHTVLALVDAGVGLNLAQPWVARADAMDISFFASGKPFPNRRSDFCQALRQYEQCPKSPVDCRNGKTARSDTCPCRQLSQPPH